MMDFVQVEQEVAKLRRDVAAGRLTEEQFKAQLREMMVEDGDGNWWMVGYETGEWYRHDGTDWVRADPPGRAVPEPAPPLVVPSARVSHSPASQLVEKTPLSPKPQRVKAIVVVILGLAISVALGYGLAVLIHETLQDLGIERDLNEALAFTCWGIVGLGGLIQSIRIARKSWRRE